MALPLWASQVWQRQPDVQALISARSAQDARTQQAIFAGLEMQMKQQELASQQRQFQEGMAFKQEQEKNAMQTKAWEMEMAQKRMDQKALVDAANIARYNAMTANYNRQHQPATVPPPVADTPLPTTASTAQDSKVQEVPFIPTPSNPVDLNSGMPVTPEGILAEANPQYTIQGGLQPTGVARESVAGETPYSPIPSLMNPAPFQPISQPPTVFTPMQEAQPEQTEAARGFNALTGNANIQPPQMTTSDRAKLLQSLTPDQIYYENGGKTATRTNKFGQWQTGEQMFDKKTGLPMIDNSTGDRVFKWSQPQDIVPKATQTNEDKLAAKIGSDIASLRGYRDALQSDSKLTDAQKKNMDDVVSELEKSEKGFNLYAARQSLLDIATQARGDIKTAAADEKSAAKIGSEQLKLAKNTLSNHVAELQKRLDGLNGPTGILAKDRDKQIADITAALNVKKSALAEIEKQLGIPTEATSPPSQTGTAKPAMSVDDIAKKYYQ